MKKNHFQPYFKIHIVPHLTEQKTLRGNSLHIHLHLQKTCLVIEYIYLAYQVKDVFLTSLYLLHYPNICISSFRCPQRAVRTRRPSLCFPVIAKLFVCQTTCQQFICSLLNITSPTTPVYQVMCNLVTFKNLLASSYMVFLFPFNWSLFLGCYNKPIDNQLHRTHAFSPSSSAHLKPVRPDKQPPAVCGPSQRVVDQSVFQGSAAHPGPGQSFLPFARQQQG